MSITWQKFGADAKLPNNDYMFRIDTHSTHEGIVKRLEKAIKEAVEHANYHNNLRLHYENKREAYNESDDIEFILSMAHELLNDLPNEWSEATLTKSEIRVLRQKVHNIFYCVEDAMNKEVE